MGRLYWSWEQVLRTDVNVIRAALREHQSLLISIFGAAESRPGADAARAGSDAPPLTPRMFDAMFAGRGRR